MPLLVLLAGAWLALIILGWSWLVTAARADRCEARRARDEGSADPG
jgi:hypothetical protein